MNTTGLCYSDIHFMLEDLGLPPMSHFGVRSPGHEGAGVVVKLGSAVTNWKLGDRAGLKPIISVCQKCELCWDDKECYCKEAVFTGLAATGSYQQYICHPANYASPIPDGVDDIVAGPIMCSASTTLRSITESGLKAGDIAVFPGGAGGVGSQGVQLAKAMGMRPIVVDTGDEKRKFAMKLGAEAFVDFKEVKDVAEAVIEAADGIGAHGVFVTAPSAYNTAISLTGSRVGAKVMCIGLPTAGTVTLGADPSLFAFRNLTIKGTLVGSMRDTALALDYAKRGLLKAICEVVPLSQMPEAVKRLQRGQVAGRIVVDFNA